ncbi:hypothetical protein GCM10010326_43790 [Streptomyces xanthochromogenes]|uniref:Transposase n=1 Tax=Streptomyces xanthochromogenes TaxID=67384 RepID=A0ABQ3ABC4_9ACTN|nr:hypothetical protein GCM10010326_43790 [Streptomyces xanthochromogenes]
MGIDGKVVQGNGHTRSLPRPMTERTRTPHALWDEELAHAAAANPALPVATAVRLVGAL